MSELQTGYEWCLEEKMRILDLKEWTTEWSFYMESYYNEKITYADFFERIKQCRIKPNSTPRKTEMFLEYRMYGLVPYNLSPIQQGIQFGHAVVEYGQLVKGIPPFEAVYDKFARKDKTFIILNGGTTNENPERFGTLQLSKQILKDNGVMFAEFREPDLNDTLTAVVFLVDERVFNRKLYPDFVEDENASDEDNEKQYQQWVEKVGGEKNVFLRTFLSPTNFKLA
jgi:hypothetical protein